VVRAMPRSLPRVQKLARNCQGQPLVVLSVSVDTDEQKWKDFVEKNEMTWPQYRDQGFAGITMLFGVQASSPLSPSTPTKFCRMNTSAMPRSRAS